MQIADVFIPYMTFGDIIISVIDAIVEYLKDKKRLLSAVMLNRDDMEY